MCRSHVRADCWSEYAATSQTGRQLGGHVLDLWFIEHVVMVTLNYDDIEFSGY